MAQATPTPITKIMRHLLEFGWDDTDKGFMMGWNSKLIESIKSSYSPEELAKLCMAMEITFKYFMKEMRGDPS